MDSLLLRTQLLTNNMKCSQLAFSLPLGPREPPPLFWALGSPLGHSVLVCLQSDFFLLARPHAALWLLRISIDFICSNTDNIDGICLAFFSARWILHISFFCNPLPHELYCISSIFPPLLASYSLAFIFCSRRIILPHFHLLHNELAAATWRIWYTWINIMYNGYILGNRQSFLRYFKYFSVDIDAIRLLRIA